MLQKIKAGAIEKLLTTNHWDEPAEKDSTI